jgi:EAL domain-containing protein (putative c-di-GMP-specific phosphodiesterase class I)
VVDDHDLLAQSLVRMLDDDPGLEVIGTESRARAGIDRAVADRPDVVIMDYVLPDMDGAMATRIIKATVPEQVVVMLTGSERPGGYAAAMAAGCDAWVRKTRAVHDLVEVIRRLSSGELVRTEEYESELPPLGELVVHYQPVIALADHHVVGFEALVRWQHPHEGLLAPGRFLPLAEETGYIIDIGSRVTQQALDDLAVWKRDMPDQPVPWMSINMSAVGLSNPDVARQEMELAARAGVDPTDLIIEITETALLEDAHEIDDNMRSLKKAGFKLALDDFGTAFSSLAYLRRFPFDRIKIDTSFTAELPHSPRAVLLVESVLHLARDMGATGIAEGIERPEQAECLMDAGWEFGQGFLYSPAVPFEVASQMAHTGRLLATRDGSDGRPGSPNGRG